MRSRFIPLVGLSLAAAGVLTAIVFISVGEHTEEQPVESVETVQRLYGGLEQDGDALGDPDAPVTISIFDDLQCTDCADYYLATVPPLIEDLVRPGDARLEFRHRSLGQKETTLAAFAAAAAGVQDYQWQYIHLVFANQDQIRVSGATDEFLARVADSIPAPQFDVDQWQADKDSPEVQAEIDSDVQTALDLRLTAAPAVVVEGPSGSVELEDSPSLDEIEAAVAEVG